MARLQSLGTSKSNLFSWREQGTRIKLERKRSKCKNVVSADLRSKMNSLNSKGN